jgi:hypothetical protein
MAGAKDVLVVTVSPSPRGQPDIESFEHAGKRAHKVAKGEQAFNAISESGGVIWGFEVGSSWIWLDLL